MLVGILSDTHNDSIIAREAVRLFDGFGVEHLIHCGDVGGEAVFDEFVGHSLTFVWGNTDFPLGGLFAYLESVGITPPRDIPTTVVLGGKKFAVFHGHESKFESSIVGLEVDVICHGHTHVARDDVVHRKRIINPGALHRARRKTVAVFDTETNDLKILDVETGKPVHG